MMEVGPQLIAPLWLCFEIVLWLPKNMNFNQTHLEKKGFFLMWLTAHFPYLINNFNLLFLLHLQSTIQSHSQGVLTPCKTLSTQIFDENSTVTTLYFPAVWVRAPKGHNINNATIATTVRILVVVIIVMNTKLAPSSSSRYAAWNTH